MKAKNHLPMLILLAFSLLFPDLTMAQNFVSAAGEEDVVEILSESEKMAPSSAKFHEVLGISSADEITRAVLVFQLGYGSAYELSREEVVAILDSYQYLSLGRTTAPASHHLHGLNYINFYTADGEGFTLCQTRHAFSVGTFGESNHLWYEVYFLSKDREHEPSHIVPNAIIARYWNEKPAESMVAPSGEPPLLPQRNFLLLPEHDWAVAGVRGAAANNVLPFELTGEYTTPIMREEFAKLIYFVLAQTQQPGVDTYSPEPSTAVKTLLNKLILFSLLEEERYRPFADDGVISTGSIEYMNYLKKFHIVEGRDDGRADPGGLLTRQEAAKILFNTGRLFVGLDASPSNFEDQHLIAEWATEAVRFTVEREIMNGVGSALFDPLGILTREQAIACAYRLYLLTSANRLPEFE